MLGNNAASARSNRLEPFARGGRTTVLVVGGGINGIGVFRELALQGVDVLLVDRGDFAS
uniref:FAD-dependent oxidoreductase n=1 Tax=Pseudolysinimonas sp. TaxID=2680009 RepID=UPI0037842EDB